MEYLYAPWRDEYVKNHDIKGCVFCHISENENLDLQNAVLFRDEVCFIVMNRFPYTPGHFMVIPHKHLDNLESLDVEQWLHISNRVHQGVKLLKSFNASGVNIGMNLGKDAGAGIAEHIHYHLVPRWGRDTNFITTIANTRVFSTDFIQIYESLKKLSVNYFI